MDKDSVIAVLEEIGTLLELKGENPFKCRAYHNAARTLQQSDQDLTTLVREKKLTEIKGIGEALAEKITELVQTGKLKYYADLKRSLPKGLLDIIKIQGLGPKRAKLLYDSLKIDSLAKLEKACRDGKIAGLPSFGEKLQDNILKGIAFLSEHSAAHRYDQAAAAAQPALEALKKVPGVKRLSVCGSLRRHKEVIRDVDILVSAKSAGPVSEAFVKLPGVERVLAHGETKSSVLTREGVQLDLRVVSDKEYPFALHYFTGSKEHNIAMRQRAQDFKLKLNEYGLFRAAGSSVPCREESDLFKALKLPFIPPELREDRGEIPAAEKGKLPNLVAEDDIRGIFHVHSTWSDGRAPLEEMIAEARRLGYEYLGMSEHSQSAAYANGLKPDRVRLYAAEIEKCRGRFKGITILLGTECDILADGSLDYDEKTLALFDFVIASVHSQFNMSEADMTRRIVKAMKNKRVTILGHPTGRLLLEREAYPLDHKQVIQAASDLGVALELNASPHRFDLDWRWGPLAKEKGVLVSIDPDAHSTAGLSVVPHGVGIARKGWLAKGDILNAMTEAQIMKFLKRRLS